MNNIPAKSVEFQLFIPMLPLIFGGKIRKMLVDLLRMSKILVDFLIFFEKSEPQRNILLQIQTGFINNNLLKNIICNCLLLPLDSLTPQFTVSEYSH